MSKQNVDVVTRYFGAATRRVASYWENPRPIADALEAGDLDPDSREVLDLIHPDMRWRNALGIVFQGKDDCARGVDELLEASRTYTVKVSEIADLDEDHVLAVLAVGMTGKSSGAAASVSIFSVHTVREGLIVETDEYLTRTEALEAVGLEQ